MTLTVNTNFLSLNAQRNLDAQSKLAEKPLTNFNSGEDQTLTLDEFEQEIGRHSDDLQLIFLELYNQCR
jgi:hypothetical protein